MERVTPGQRPRPNSGHPHAIGSFACQRPPHEASSVYATPPSSLGPAPASEPRLGDHRHHRRLLRRRHHQPRMGIAHPPRRHHTPTLRQRGRTLALVGRAIRRIVDVSAPVRARTFTGPRLVLRRPSRQRHTQGRTPHIDRWYRERMRSTVNAGAHTHVASTFTALLTKGLP